jgi:CheY-like chemotaxis protein
MRRIRREKLIPRTNDTEPHQPKARASNFTYRPNGPVLVVEDSEDRISWFRQRLPQAVFAKNAEAAFRALDQQEFRVIFLDHDLHWMHADNSIFKGTGKEVARFLAKKDLREIMIIHSKNVEGAAAMKKYLSNARLAPFWMF